MPSLSIRNLCLICNKVSFAAMDGTVWKVLLGGRHPNKNTSHPADESKDRERKSGRTVVQLGNVRLCTQ